MKIDTSCCQREIVIYELEYIVYLQVESISVSYRVSPISPTELYIPRYLNTFLTQA